MNEQFSAFLDGEATRDESDSVVAALLRDERLRNTWSRQYWLRTTLRAHRGEVAVAPDPAFASRVMEAIGGDRISNTKPAEHLESAQRPQSARRRRRWRHLGGFAVAASAAGVVFLVSGNLTERADDAIVAEPSAATTAEPTPVQTSRDVANTPGDAVDMVASSNLAAGATRQASSAASATPAVNGPADHWSVSDPALADELNSYLVEHNGLARGYGLSGTTSAFVRVATYGQEPTQ